MAYLHDVGLVHSDLRGVSHSQTFDSELEHMIVLQNNVLVDINCNVLVADYGQAFFPDDPLQDVTNQGCSTQWMAPEMLNPGIFSCTFRPTKASDVYAFACLIIEVFLLRSSFWLFL